MERYFFHLFDEMETRDEEGIELADLGAVRRQAMTSAHELMCDQLRRGYLNLGHRIEVEDQAGAPILTLTFASAVNLQN